MTLIELPDEQAAALEAIATAEGLTLTAWLQTLVVNPPAKGRTSKAKEAVASILEIQKQVKPDPDGWTVKDYINFGRP